MLQIPQRSPWDPCQLPHLGLGQSKCEGVYVFTFVCSEHFLLDRMVSLTASCLQTISGLVLRVDLESAETPPQPFEGSLPSLWLLLLLWQPL